MDLFSECCNSESLSIPNIEIENIYYSNFRECIQTQMETAYARDLFGKTDSQDYYSNMNKFHYLMIILDEAWNEYTLWLTNLGHNPSEQEFKDEQKLLFEKYKFSCLVKSFMCMGCNIDSIFNLFCHTPIPSADNVQTFCINETPTVSDLMPTEANWYDLPSGGNLIDPATFLLNNGVYYGSYTENGCESPIRLQVTVHINPVSVVPTNITVDYSTICEGSSATLIVTGGLLRPGATILWHRDSCDGPIIETGDTLTVSPMITTTYYVEYLDSEPCAISTGCISATITVIERLEMDILKNPPVTCAGVEFQYVAYPSNGSGYVWTIDGVEGVDYTLVSTTDTNILTLIWLTAGEHWVSVYCIGEDGCLLTTTTRTTTVYLPAEADAGDNMTYCTTENPIQIIGATYLPVDGTILWTTNGHGTFDDDSIINPTYTPTEDDYGTVVTMTLSVENGYCIAAEDTMTITFELETIPGTLSQNQTICYNTIPEELTISGNNCNIVKWQYSVFPFTIWNDIAITTNTYVPSALLYTRKYRVIIQCGTCQQAASNIVTITVNQQVLSPSGDSSQFFCIENSPTIADLIALGSNIQWYASSSGGSALSSSTSLVDGTHYYASQTVNGCESVTRFDVTVTVYEVPTIELGDNPTVCSGSTSAILPKNSSSGNPIKYSIDYDATANTAGFIDVTNDTVPLIDFNLVVPAGAAVGTYNGSLTVQNSSNGRGCYSEAYPFTVTIIQRAKVVIEDSNITVCIGALTGDLIYSDPLGEPDVYSINFNAAAEAAGFIDLADITLPASPIAIDIPVGCPIGVYSAIFSVKNSATGCTTEYNITITVESCT